MYAWQCCGSCSSGGVEVSRCWQTTVPFTNSDLEPGSCPMAVIITRASHYPCQGLCQRCYIRQRSRRLCVREFALLFPSFLLFLFSFFFLSSIYLSCRVSANYVGFLFFLFFFFFSFTFLCCEGSRHQRCTRESYPVNLCRPRQ